MSSPYPLPHSGIPNTRFPPGLPPVRSGVLEVLCLGSCSKRRREMFPRWWVRHSLGASGLFPSLIAIQRQRCRRDEVASGTCPRSNLGTFAASLRLSLLPCTPLACREEGWKRGPVFLHCGKGLCTCVAMCVGTHALMCFCSSNRIPPPHPGAHCLWVPKTHRAWFWWHIPDLGPQGS